MKVADSSGRHLIIDDFFTENEVKNVWLELDFLTRKEIMLSPENSNGARDPLTNVPLKKNNVIFLDNIYQDRKTSNILNIFEKIYSEEVTDIIDDLPNEFKYFKFIGHERTFISYYENNDYYKPHVDHAILTCLYWCNKTPQSFEGGDLILGDDRTEIKYKNNRLVIFPSHNTHSVDPIKMIQNTNQYSGFGRYTISKFLFVTPKQ
jgi:Rps23 Pro-64 3,4-dihydroxylase Tpa1-like proline 4-hydroxylase